MNLALFFSTVRTRTLSIALLAGIFLFLTKFSLAEETVKHSLSEEQTRAIKSQLGPFPQGFSWHIYKDVGLLKPIGWHERSVSNVGLENVPSSYTYATSPEDFDVGKPFDVGLTVEIFSGAEKSPQMSAHAIAAAYIEPLLKVYKAEDFLILDQKTEGDLEKQYLRYHSVPKRLVGSPETEKMKPAIIHKFILVNNKANSVHVFTFESLEESWESNWTKYGQPMIKNIRVLFGIGINQ